jgi:hypothetical protein
MLTDLKNSLLINLKNAIGWRTRRKIVVFCVDDYGNVRLDSKSARENLDRAGLKVRSRFDAYDTLETREDLEALFATLTSVADQRGRPAVFTPYALPGNLDFERVAATGYTDYHYELLPQTYDKLAARDPQAYRGAWALWQEGLEKGLMRPQFHGREHLNVRVFRKKLARQDGDLMTALRNRSYTSLRSLADDRVAYTVAYGFWDFSENEDFAEILTDGLAAFETVYGYRATGFTPPGFQAHPVLHPVLREGGIKYLDGLFVHREHQGQGRYRRRLGYTGQTNDHGQLTLVRNVVFEPTEDRGIDWVAYTLQQIEAAFRWNRPAIVSSHRVNFCGHIDPKNRAIGLEALQQLLKQIVRRWPEVEFLAIDELGDQIH